MAEEDDDEGEAEVVHTEDGEPLPYLLVMDSGGPSLFHVLASQRIAGIDIAKCSALFRSLVQQTASLHSDGVAHCDIKPRCVRQLRRRHACMHTRRVCTTTVAAWLVERC